ncbi:ABC transporter substrate-binding protein [Floccifex sp.]|uniref:ABC transporter substrate-binding protein n=1 Tax=Floccifex sp. TaxID=2815810 RepID=UPI002A752F78|nr:ABC transporter substrate-binding protein [Floccifex sp.]MDD7281496.1 ABC transporter substrate-binding protein [Erysipelotrichaceae bacterium]MDY2958948.1 ABC transporter substrate-binding protein [Floccifex sp.]
MKKNFLSLTVSVAMAGTLLAGCSSGGDDKGKVYWLNFKPEADEALQQIAKDYTEETGVEVKIVTAASGTYQETLTAEMDKSEAPTLFVVGNQAAVKTWGDYCYDLSDTDVYKELTTDDFTLYNGDEVASIGYCYETYGIITNKALLAKAGYSVDDITNFESLKAVAEDIHARAGELGFDAFTSSGMDDSSSWRFTGHLANLPLYYESVDDNWTECPAEIKGTYLDNFKQIWDLYINNSAYDKTTLATGGYDAEGEFKDGKAVFFQNGSWEYAALSEAIADDDMTMIPIYTGVEGEENQGLCSGTENCWAVNKNASEADIQATLDFMYWLVTSEEGTQMMAEQFGEIPYKGATENNNVFFKAANEALEAGKYSVAWTFNYTPNVEQWRGGLVSAMNQYDNGGSWDDVVSAFVDGWATQYKEANAN